MPDTTNDDALQSHLEEGHKHGFVTDIATEQLPPGKDCP